MRNVHGLYRRRVSMAFPRSRADHLAGRSGGSLPKWPPEFCTLADLRRDIATADPGAWPNWSRIPTRPPPCGATRREPPGNAAGHARRRCSTPNANIMHWLNAQVNRRWANGFFCLAFVMMGIPVSMRARSRDYLTSFFACFLPVVLLNHPLHNFCIKLAESGRAPAQLPWLGNVLLICLGRLAVEPCTRAIDCIPWRPVTATQAAPSEPRSSLAGSHDHARHQFELLRPGRRYPHLSPGQDRLVQPAAGPPLLFGRPRAADSVRRVGRRVVRIEVYGLPLGSGYRLMLDYPQRRPGASPSAARPGRSRRPVDFTGLFCLAASAAWAGFAKPASRPSIIPTRSKPGSSPGPAAGDFAPCQTPGWPTRSGGSSIESSGRMT